MGVMGGRDYPPEDFTVAFGEVTVPIPKATPSSAVSGLRPVEDEVTRLWREHYDRGVAEGRKVRVQEAYDEGFGDGRREAEAELDRLRRDLSDEQAEVKRLGANCDLAAGVWKERAERLQADAAAGWGTAADNARRAEEAELDVANLRKWRDDVSRELLARLEQVDGLKAENAVLRERLAEAEEERERCDCDGVEPCGCGGSYWQNRVAALREENRVLVRQRDTSLSGHPAGETAAEEVERRFSGRETADDLRTDRDYWAERAREAEELVRGLSKHIVELDTIIRKGTVDDDGGV